LRGSSADQLAQAQYGALAKQIPALYVVLSVNIATLAFTFYGSEPDYLTTVAPAVFLLLTGGRAIHWLRADVDRITREFVRTTFSALR
jgi:predicted signal transduction protein with EAL and GGDEF domain